MFETISAFWADYGNVLIEGTWETLIMVVLSTVLAYVIGVPLGVALIVTQPQGIRPHKGLYGVLGWIVNIGRSLPFAILLVAIMPYTRFLVGTAIGVRGAIPPLVISAAPFVARMVETSLSEVDAGVVEAAQSMGASPLQIFRKVYLPEAHALPGPGRCHLRGDDSGLYRYRRYGRCRRLGQHCHSVRPQPRHYLFDVGDRGLPDHLRADRPVGIQLVVQAH